MRPDHVTVTATFDGKKLQFSADEQDQYFNAVKRLRLGLGEQVEIRIEPLEAARSLRANREYWGFVVRPVSLYTRGAMSLVDVHRYFKAEHLPSERFVLADPETGEVKLERDLERLTTTTLSEDEFRNYMERCRATAATECGIDFSDRGLYEQFGILSGR